METIKQSKRDRDGKVRSDTTLNRVVSEDLAEKVIFVQKLEGEKQVSTP